MTDTHPAIPLLQEIYYDMDATPAWRAFCKITAYLVHQPIQLKETAND